MPRVAALLSSVLVVVAVSVGFLATIIACDCVRALPAPVMVGFERSSRFLIAWLPLALAYPRAGASMGRRMLGWAWLPVGVAFSIHPDPGFSVDLVVATVVALAGAFVVAW